jgi:hypothetical protein
MWSAAVDDANRRLEKIDDDERKMNAEGGKSKAIDTDNIGKLDDKYHELEALVVRGDEWIRKLNQQIDSIRLKNAVEQAQKNFNSPP